tara:strand:- start:1743 stop:2705 length:963 start_codon:yes stop_codon:yes gene_type:complete
MAASINEVRNTVLAIANKNNYGYISPQDFNLYAQQAQMDMFEDYFYAYNSWIQRQNARQSGTGYADIEKGLVEVIDTFSTQVFLSQVNANTFALPSNYYLINKLFYYSTPLFTGTITGVGLNNEVTDSTQSAVWTNIPASQTVPLIGSIIVNTTTLQEAYVTAVDAPGTGGIKVSSPIFAVDDKYVIYSDKHIREVERVNQNKIFLLTNSILTAPTKTYPAYVLDGNTVTVYPTTIMNAGAIRSQYIRYPFVPKWTYVDLGLGEPVFNANQPDFQDFELPDSDEPTLIAKICQYVGIEIREADVYNFGKTEETSDTQETS